MRMLYTYMLQEVSRWTLLAVQQWETHFLYASLILKICRSKYFQSVARFSLVKKLRYITVK